MANKKKLNVPKAERVDRLYLCGSELCVFAAIPRATLQYWQLTGEAPWPTAELVGYNRKFFTPKQVIDMVKKFLDHECREAGKDSILARHQYFNLLNEHFTANGKRRKKAA